MINGTTLLDSFRLLKAGLKGISVYASCFDFRGSSLSAAAFSAANRNKTRESSEGALASPLKSCNFQRCQKIEEEEEEGMLLFLDRGVGLAFLSDAYKPKAGDVIQRTILPDLISVYGFPIPLQKRPVRKGCFLAFSSLAQFKVHFNAFSFVARKMVLCFSFDS